jgi:hypothetical protein
LPIDERLARSGYFCAASRRNAVISAYEWYLSNAIENCPDAGPAAASTTTSARTGARMATSPR